MFAKETARELIKNQESRYASHAYLLLYLHTMLRACSLKDVNLCLKDIESDISGNKFKYQIWMCFYYRISHIILVELYEIFCWLVIRQAISDKFLISTAVISLKYFALSGWEMIHCQMMKFVTAYGDNSKTSFMACNVFTYQFLSLFFFQKLLRATCLFAGSIFIMRNFGNLMAVWDIRIVGSSVFLVHMLTSNR